MFFRLFPAVWPEKGDVRRKRPAAVFARTCFRLFCGTAATDSDAPPSCRIASCLAKTTDAIADSNGISVMTARR
jgi:hypothetical protein